MSSAIDNLRILVENHAHTVLTPTAVPRLDILKVCQPTRLFPEIYKPLISLILQGGKRLIVGREVVSYSAGSSFISSVDLPVIGEVVEASPDSPYLALRLSLNRNVITELLQDMLLPSMPSSARTFCVDRADDDLIDAWLRMARLIDQSDDIAVMAPLIEREIIYRMLRGPQRAVLMQVAGVDDRFVQITQALSWMRANYELAFRVEDLARTAHMSSSAFHRHFKAAVGLSPLQYQKQIRLYEARRMLFAEPSGVAAVASAVGYESLSQFSREYARQFGAPPASDVRHLRKCPFGRTNLA